MTQTPTTKCCTKCGTEYPATLEYFPKKRGASGGLGSWCRNCLKVANREYRQKNKESIAESERLRYNKNLEKRREQNRESYRRMKERLGERVREYKRNMQRKYRARLRAEKMRPFESDDYSDLLPVNEHDWFRSWAVITSWEYAAHFNRKTGLEYPEEKEN